MEEEVISMGYAVKDARGGAAYLLANSFITEPRKSGAAPSPHKSKQLARVQNHSKFMQCQRLRGKYRQRQYNGQSDNVGSILGIIISSRNGLLLTVSSKPCRDTHNDCWLKVQLLSLIRFIPSRRAVPNLDRPLRNDFRHVILESR